MRTCLVCGKKLPEDKFGSICTDCYPKIPVEPGVYHGASNKYEKEDSDVGVAGEG